MNYINIVWIELHLGSNRASLVSCDTRECVAEKCVLFFKTKVFTLFKFQLIFIILSFIDSTNFLIQGNKSFEILCILYIWKYGAMINLFYNSQYSYQHYLELILHINNRN